MVLTRILIVAVLVVVGGQRPASAQDWARKMFAEVAHDFGTVARGAKTEHAFVFTNSYQGEVHVAGVRSSCGCTTPRIEKDTLKTYEQGAVIAHINSQSFLGSQGATITVTFDRPYRAEVQLHVKVYVRTDVRFVPESVVFGSVESGSGSKKIISVDYAGQRDWRIVEIKSPSPHIAATFQETGRSKGRVTYDLKVALSEDAPAGSFGQHLILVTNDRPASHIPLALEGQVLPDLSISPATLFVGVVKPGDRVTRSIVVRSKQPFLITGIASECPCLQASVPAGQTGKSLFVIPVSFVAGEPGKLQKSIRIETDRGVLTAQVSACVVQPSPQ